MMITGGYAAVRVRRAPTFWGSGFRLDVIVMVIMAAMAGVIALPRCATGRAAELVPVLTLVRTATAAGRRLASSLAILIPVVGRLSLRGRPFSRLLRLELSRLPDLLLLGPAVLKPVLATEVSV